MFAAARSDLFGERPDLMSRIELTDQTFANVSGFVGQLVGVAVSAKFGHFVAMSITAGLAAFSIFLIALQKETLLPEKRKPFSISGVLRKGNPLSNLHLLLCHGPGLRKLTGMVTLFFCYQSSLQFGPSYRFGPMEMSPQDSSLFDAVKMPVAAASSGALVAPFVKAVATNWKQASLRDRFRSRRADGLRECVCLVHERCSGRAADAAIHPARAVRTAAGDCAGGVRDVAPLTCCQAGHRGDHCRSRRDQRRLRGSRADRWRDYADLLELCFCVLCQRSRLNAVVLAVGQRGIPDRRSGCMAGGAWGVAEPQAVGPLAGGSPAGGCCGTAKMKC